MKFDPENSPFNLIDRTQFLNISALLEFMIAIFAILLGWLVGVPPLENLRWDGIAVMWGILSVLPLLLYFFVSTKTKFRPLVEIRDFLVDQIGPILSQCRWPELLCLSLVIGFSEELLFRGVVQQWLTRYGVILAIIVSNLIFALVHSVSVAYVVVTFLIGLYLGASLYLTEDQNLLVPMISHALYDFIAFLIIKKLYRAKQPEESSEKSTV